MSQVHNFSFGGGAFEWFIGVVEDRNDPEKLGRLRVRAFGYYDDEAIPTSDLPWAVPMQPITSSAKGGVGSSPTGIQEGSHVVGFFADGKNAQTPIIMGTLAGAPGGKPDTNNLARGEDLGQTVIAEKVKAVKMSLANSNALSGLSAATNMANKINSTVKDAKSKLNSVRDQFSNIAGLSNLPFMAGLNNISSTMTQIATLPSEAKALQAQVEGEVNAIKGQIENLKNLDPEALARQLVQNQVGDVEAAVRAIKSLDFDSVMSSIQSIPMAIGQIGRLQDAITNAGNIGKIVTTIQGLSRSIPNLGSIRALGTTVASMNGWLEPTTMAAPLYPLNKIMETEGGHLQEFDDTPGKERFHQYHPTGTFKEVHPDGSNVDKVVKDNYRVVMGDDYLHVEGKVQVNIVGDATVVVNGDCTTQVSGNKTDIVNGNYSLAAGGNVSIASGGAITIGAATQMAIRALMINLN